MTAVVGTGHAGRRLVGRQRELAELIVALEGAVAGQGATVLVGGEPGIGKSRLVEAFAGAARERGAAVLTGRCLDLVGPGVPYLPFAEALGARVGDGPLDPQRLRTAIEETAVQGPFVIVLEDLHWADESTLDQVAVLTHALVESHAVIAATYRPRHNDRLTTVVAELLRARAATAVDLDPLGRSEIEELIERRAGGLVPSDVSEPIVTRAEGNPFFAEELYAAHRRGETTLPRGIGDALLQRFERLDPSARAVARIASAVGGDVSYALLAAVAPLPEPLLVEALRQAVAQDVLVADRGRGTLRFRHALLAEAVYATLLPGECDAVHDAIARVLTESPDLAVNGTVASELARHWAAAGRVVPAMAESLRAADEAEAVGGPAEALRHLEQAVSLWSAVPEPPRPDRAALLARAAEHAHVTGRGPRAVELVSEALRLSGDSPALLERLGSYLLPTGDRVAGLAALRRAADLTPKASPSAARVEVLTTLANAMRLSAEFAQATQVCDEAIAEAAALPSPRLADRATDIRALGLTYLERPTEGFAILDRACAESWRRSTPLDVLCPFVLYSDALLAHGRPAEAAVAARRGLPMARELGVDRGVGTLLAANLADALLCLGDWDEAEAVLTAALRTAGAFWPHHLHRAQARLAVGRGEFEEGRRHLRLGARAGTEPPAAPAYAGVVAELELWAGNADAAASTVDTALAADGQDRVFTRTWLCALGLRAHADQETLARAAGDAAAADASRDRARRMLETARSGAGQPGDAPLWMAVAEAEYARAPDSWQTAVDATLARPYVQGYCQWQLAAALLAAGAHRVSVTAAARAAHRTAIDLDAAPLRREVELLAQRARLDLVGIRGAVPSPPRLRKSHGLTAREDEVLRLLTRGYTNREIAAELGISAKTASVHVTNILRKLGASRRTEAAALAQRLAGDTAEITNR